MNELMFIPIHTDMCEYTGRVEVLLSLYISLNCRAASHMPNTQTHKYDIIDTAKKSIKCIYRFSNNGTEG